MERFTRVESESHIKNMTVTDTKTSAKVYLFSSGNTEKNGNTKAKAHAVIASAGFFTIPLPHVSSYAAIAQISAIAVLKNIGGRT